MRSPLARGSHSQHSRSAGHHPFSLCMASSCGRGWSNRFEWDSILVSCLILLSWMTSCTVGIPMSLWIISLVKYHGASTVALNILDLHLCMTSKTCRRDLLRANWNCNWKIWQFPFLAVTSTGNVCVAPIFIHCSSCGIFWNNGFTVCHEFEKFLKVSLIEYVGLLHADNFNGKDQRCTTDQTFCSLELIHNDRLSSAFTNTRCI